MLKRLPKFSETIAVYSVVAAMAYGWNLVHFFWKVPSWILFLALGDLFALLAYALTAALLESLLITAVVLLICFLLPEPYFRSDFTVRATWLVVAGYGGMMVMLSLNAAHGAFMGKYWNLFTALTALLAALAAYASTRVSMLRSAALWLSDRFIIFLFILVPASLISLIVVLIRNLLA